MYFAIVVSVAIVVMNIFVTFIGFMAGRGFSLSRSSSIYL